MHNLVSIQVQEPRMIRSYLSIGYIIIWVCYLTVSMQTSILLFCTWHNPSAGELYNMCISPNIQTTYRQPCCALLRISSPEPSWQSLLTEPPTTQSCVIPLSLKIPFCICHHLIPCITWTPSSTKWLRGNTCVGVFCESPTCC